MRLRCAFLALLALGNAQMELVAQIPSCGMECIVQALPSTNCTFTDVSCVCASEPLWAQVSMCALTTCSVKDALTSRRIATVLCNQPFRDRSRLLSSVAPTLCGVSLILLTLRLMSRLSGLNGMVGWDDAVISAAFVIGAAIAPLAVILCKLGLGKDIWMVPFPDIPNMLRLFWLCQSFYIISVNLSKIALLLFFLRVFPQQWFKRWCWCMIGFVVVYCVVFLFATIFQCAPVNYAWNRWDGEAVGKCTNIYVATYANASINMVTDLVILAMPMPMLFKLHVSYSWKKKARIFVMFSFGIIITIVSALRLRALVVYGQSFNITWDFADAGMWSAIECYTAIMCACLPAARMFVIRTAPKWLGLSSIHSSHSRAKTPSAERDVVRNHGTAPQLRGVPHATTMAMSFHDRNDGFTELDEVDDNLPLHGTTHGRPSDIQEVEEDRSWSSIERAESGYSTTHSTKQWS